MRFNRMNQPMHGSQLPMRRLRASRRGITLLEVIISMFIFLVGIVGVLAAMPAGVNSAIWVIFQDASLHLAHSKFSEFRRDRVDPVADLINGSAYMAAKQEPNNSSGAPWHDFASAPGQTYQYFDDITRYEWSIDSGDVFAGSGAVPKAPAGTFYPDKAGNPINLKRITVVVRMKGTTREFRYTQYMVAYQ